MSDKIDSIVKSLIGAVEVANSKKTEAYDTTATVNRVEDGIAWVHIPGGVSETPVKLTSNAKKGDTVQVRVSGGTAFIIGNVTSPPTDDTKANVAHEVAIIAESTAVSAKDIADAAQMEAIRAGEAADAAEAEAIRAGDAADASEEHAQTALTNAGLAQTAANNAQTSANNALTYANTALTQLSIVEDVAGVVSWIQDHGSYTVTSDTSVQEGTIYFIYNSTTQDYEPIVSPDTTKNPHQEGWYVLDISDSQSEYIMAHLAVTSRGLWVLPSGKGTGTTPASGESQADSDARQASNYKVLLSSSGMYVYDGSGNQVSLFGANIEFSSTRPQYIGNNNTYIVFDPANGGSITIGGGSRVTIGTNKTLDDVLTDLDVTVTQTSTGADITVNGDTVSISNGQDGQDGAPGADGYSPTATVTKSGDTATITITDKNGTTTQTVSDGTDGQDGQDGAPGADGYSPTATVTKSGDTATISITDKNGTTTQTVSDGTDGQPGSDGADGATIWTATANPTTPNYTFNISDLTGQTGRTPQVGDIVVRSYYRYTITSVGSTTVLTGTRTSIRGAAGADGQMLYATCSTADDVAAKVATLSAGTLTLTTGAAVAVTFQYSNHADNPTLNVSGTGAKDIIAIGDNLDEESAYNWVADATVTFVYDGTHWQMDGTASLSKAEDAQTTANNAIISYNDINLFINGGYITETSSPYEIDELKVDKTVFYGEVEGEFGSYTFSYNGANWIFNGSTIDLISYGISLSATPTSGDVITVDLVDVEGTVTDLTDQISELSETVDANEAKAASDLESAQNELKSAINANSSVITETQNTVANISTKTQNMNWSEDYGLVLLAPNASPDTGYKLQLAAQAINFRNGALNNPSSILASIAADDSENVFMMISDAVIKNQLRFGKFAFIPRTNGNMSLKYLG